MFPHDGSCATLEDWFDPRRLKDDYVPTGFKGFGIKTRAVKGHIFGLGLSADDKRAAGRVSEDSVTESRAAHGTIRRHAGSAVDGQPMGRWRSSMDEVNCFGSAIITDGGVSMPCSRRFPGGTDTRGFAIVTGGPDRVGVHHGLPGAA